MIKEVGIFCGELHRRVGIFDPGYFNGFFNGKARPSMFYSEQMLYKDPKF
jgi:hypothetical protein